MKLTRPPQSDQSPNPSRLGDTLVNPWSFHAGIRVRVQLETLAQGKWEHCFLVGTTQERGQSTKTNQGRKKSESAV